ncbi:MAG: hypothetical protein IT304_12410, partial [Dehalococcoidia bacterium]|nr:hypothetical protein [Dehalococcoidia bacterium]
VALPELPPRLAKLLGGESLEVDGETANDAPPPSMGGGSPTGSDSAVRGASAIVTEYIRHSKLSPEALVKLTRELRDALR